MTGRANRASNRSRYKQLRKRRLAAWFVVLFLLHLPAQVCHSSPGVRAAKGVTAPESTDRPARIGAEADALRAGWTEDSLRAAADRFMEARAGWLAAGQTGEAIDALMGAAEAHFALSEYRQALRLYTAAMAESRSAGDRQREHAALTRAGRVHSYLGDNGLAQRQIQAALTYYEQHGSADGPALDRRLLAEALNALGEVYHTKGVPLKALGLFQRALPLWNGAGDQRGEALTQLNIGHALAGSGDLEGAAARFEAALALARAASDRTVEAAALSGAGVTDSFGGRDQAALGLHLEALSVARSAGNRQGEAVALNGLGQAYEGLGKQDVALDYYEQALRLFLDNESLDFSAGTEYRIARTYRLTGRVPQALEHYRQCIELSRRANKKRFEAYALTDIATIYHTQGKRGDTLDRYNKALKLYGQLGDYRGQATVLNRIGDLASESGDKRRALTFYKSALPLTQKAGDREAELSTLYSAALAARDCGDLEQALEHAESSVQLVETLRTYVTGPDLRASYFASVHRHYGLYVNLLMRLDERRPGGEFAAAAFQASERARARTLLELLAENRADMRGGSAPALLQRERELEQALRLKARQRMQLSSDAETATEAEEAARELRRLTAEYQLVQAQIREQNPRYAALTQPQPASLKEIQTALRGENTALLEYALGEERSYLWVVTEDSLSSYELPGRAVIEEKAREVYGLLTSRQSPDGEIDAAYQERVAAADAAYDERSLALSRMLLAPAASQLGGRRLLVVAEGVLQYIPFEALPVPDAAPSEGGPLLVSRHEVISLPSASALIKLRQGGTRVAPATGLVAVLADPVYAMNDPRVSRAGRVASAAASKERDAAASQRLALSGFDGPGGAGGFARLRHTSDEAEAIMSLVPSGSGMVATGFEASRETAMRPSLGQYQILHIAAHGLVNSKHPELSGIILSLVDQEGGPSDGFLQLQDIYNLDLPVELVVLSACNTGIGEDVKGEGLIGLTRVFMHAGAKSVVSSLWKVDDAATAELMRHFYKAMLEEGLPPAAALRRAKDAMRQQRRWRAPYYWAGFVFQGEYRQHLKAGGARPAAWFILLLVVCSGGATLYLCAKLQPLCRRTVASLRTPE